MNLITIYVVLTRTIGISLICAAGIYLYRKATGLEKGDIVSPFQKQILDVCTQISYEIEQIVLQIKPEYHDTSKLDRSYK